MSATSEERLKAFNDWHAVAGCKPSVDDCAVCWIGLEMFRFKKRSREWRDLCGRMANALQNHHNFCSTKIYKELQKDRIIKVLDEYEKMLRELE